MRGSFWQTIKDYIPFKEFDEWRNNSVVFRAFLQKEAVREKNQILDLKNQYLDYLFATKEEAAVAGGSSFNNIAWIGALAHSGGPLLPWPLGGKASLMWGAAVQTFFFKSYYFQKP
jgi:hypothetical protein